MSLQPNFQNVTHQMLKLAVECRTQEIAAYVSSETKNIVQSGPFKGMILPDEHSWGSGDVVPKLLGTYEQELHMSLELAIARKPEVVFNVGAAEGYYAVGLARRLPEATVFAFDTDCNSHSVCLDAFAINLARIRGGVGGEFRRSLVTDWKPLYNSMMVMDVEGAELEILSEEMVAALKHCDLIVECHDFITPGISSTLIGRLKPTHDIGIVSEGPRDPHKISLLQKMCTLDKNLALSENRPSTMSWLIAWAKERV